MANGSQRGKSDGCGTRLRGALDVLAEVVGHFEPHRFSGADAVRLTELFAWGERLCATGKALSAERAAETGAWDTGTDRSAAEWLARISGQSAGAAAGAIETAKRLKDQPDVEKAAREGKLSEQQSKTVSATAKKAPDKTNELLDRAKSDSLAALRERAREIQLAADKAEDDREQYRRVHAGRYLRLWCDDDGAGRINGRFTADQLAEIQAALVPFQDEIFRAARRAGLRERRECHAADALVAMARAANESQPDDAAGDDAEDDGSLPSDHPAGPDPTRPTPGGQGGTGVPAAGRGTGGPGGPAGHGRAGRQGRSGDDADPRRRRVSRRRPPTIIIRIDHGALVRGWREADECSEIDGIGPVPVATVRAMMTDAFLAAVVTDGLDVRSVVHLGRYATAAQRTALLVRDTHCVVPGCHVTQGLEIDHVAEWAPTQVTVLDHLARLCHIHHAQKTYQGAKLSGRPGRWRWIPPPEEANDPSAGRQRHGTGPPAAQGGEPRPGHGTGPSHGRNCGETRDESTSPSESTRPSGRGPVRGPTRTTADQRDPGPTSLFDAGEEPFPP